MSPLTARLRTAPVALAVLLSIAHRHANAQADLQAPPFPPHDWRLVLTIDVSSDLVYKAIGHVPAEHEFLLTSPMMFWLESDGSLQGPWNHPLLSGRIVPDQLFTNDDAGFGRVVGRL